MHQIVFDEIATVELKKNKIGVGSLNLKWNEYLRQSVIIDEKVSEAIAKANENLFKAKKDLSKLDEFIFNGGVK